MAFPRALVAAAQPVPEVAVLEAVHHATHAFGDPGYRGLYDELRQQLGR